MKKIGNCAKVRLQIYDISIDMNTSGNATVAVLGAGSFGTVFAKILAENGHSVRLWNWAGDPGVLAEIEKNHTNKKYLPGVKLPKKIIPEGDLRKAVAGAEAVFFAVPSNVVARVADDASPFLEKNTIIVDICKGLIPDSLELVSACMVKRVDFARAKSIVAIAGPAIAKQLATKKFTAMNIAGKSRANVERVRALVENEYVRLIYCPDIVGLEIGGVGKNVYAIVLGLADGVGLDLNAKAVLLTVAMKEISNLVKAMGGKKETAYDLAGFGDLIGTAFSPDSRNRRFGEYLGKGIGKEKALTKVGQVVEGVSATDCFIALAEKQRVQVPLARMTREAMAGNRGIKEIIMEFLRKL